MNYRVPLSVAWLVLMWTSLPDVIQKVIEAVKKIVKNTGLKLISLELLSNSGASTVELQKVDLIFGTIRCGLSRPPFFIFFWGLFKSHN